MRWSGLMLCWALAGPAAAQVTLLDDGRWRVTGLADAAAPQIAVSVDDVPSGSFAALQFAFTDGSGLEQVLVLRGDGTIEPNLAGSPVGATATLGSYWDCESGFIGPLRFVSLELPARSKNSGVLDLRGQLSNLDSLQSDKFRLRIKEPKPERLRLEFKYRLVTTREICIDKEKRDTDEEFHAAELAASYLGPAEHTNDLTRYVKDLDVDCDPFDCDVDKITFCAGLANETGPVIDNPKRLEDKLVSLFHTSSAPAPTPTLEFEWKSPHPHDLKPQGFVTASSDPAERNVAFWADWVEVNGHYGARKKLANFHFALEAEPPRSPSCDRVQDD